MDFQCFISQCKPSEPTGILKATSLSTNKPISRKMFKTHILLDNQTSDHLMVNQAFAGKVEKVSQGINMHANTGVQAINHKAPLSNIGKVWFDDQMMANVLGQATQTSKLTMLRKPRMEGIISPSHTNQPVRPSNSHELVFIMLASQCLQQGVSLWFRPWKTIRKLLTRAQVEWADKAKTLMKTLMMPTIKMLKQAILTNQIQNCLVTD